MTRNVAIGAAATLALMLTATFAAGEGWISRLFGGGEQDRFAECRTGQVAGGAGQIGGDFTLVDAQGETVTSDEVLTEPSLLYFGYTFCPDVCPLDTARNVAAVEILEERGQMVTPVFISVDPARDTPEVVGDFAANLHPRMIGLTGSEEQVQEASKAYRTYFKRHDDTEDDYYLVDHSTFSYLVLPDHGFVEFFRREIGPEEMADAIGCFLENS
ncbi:MAG: SCO family protein [Paracoccaceae bacterium]